MDNLKRLKMDERELTNEKLCPLFLSIVSLRVCFSITCRSCHMELGLLTVHFYFMTCAMNELFNDDKR